MQLLLLVVLLMQVMVMVSADHAGMMLLHQILQGRRGRSGSGTQVIHNHQRMVMVMRWWQTTGRRRGFDVFQLHNNAHTRMRSNRITTGSILFSPTICREKEIAKKWGAGETGKKCPSLETH